MEREANGECESMRMGKRNREKEREIERKRGKRNAERMK